MAFFKGAAKEAHRAAILMRQREKEKQEIDWQKRKLESELKIGEISNKFTVHYDAVEQILKSDTVGLVTLDEMKALQEAVVSAREKQLASTRHKDAHLVTGSSSKQQQGHPLPQQASEQEHMQFQQYDQDQDDRENRARLKRKEGPLSFNMEESDEDNDDEDQKSSRETEDDEDQKSAIETAEDWKKPQETTEPLPNSATDTDDTVHPKSDGEKSRNNSDHEDEVEKEQKLDPDLNETSFVAKKRRRYGMNPSVDTSFLPDIYREEEENRLREELRREWVRKQAAIKDEEVSITYSYWDGSGHRRQIKMKKGHSIHLFLHRCLDQLRKEFPELKAISADQMMYVKEDLIIPHDKTFYDFIVTKARGKSGPLFKFDVHDDIRMRHDASVEKEESHAGKVCMRNWYERNKHIFPASRWEPYDPTKNWDQYTISDKLAAKITIK